MVEAAIKNTPAPHVLVTESAGAFNAIDLLEESVAVVAVPKFFRSGPILRWVSTRKVARVLRAANSVSVVGADMLDGNYTIVGSLSRISVLALAVRNGLPARVFGFSFSDSPEPTISGALASLGSQVELCARDPRSYDRLLAIKSVSVVQSADIVFTSTDVSVPSDYHFDDISYAIVNVSGLIESRFPGHVLEYGSIIKTIREMGIDRIIFLPHVLTQSDKSDPSACRAAFTSFSTERDVLIERTLRPAEIRGLAQRATVVVTGRMHLAVMSLGQGTPVVTLSTQGKVEGLYDLFDLPEFVVSPVSGFGAEVASLLASSDLDEVRTRIQARQNYVNDLAHRSFATDLG